MRVPAPCPTCGRVAELPRMTPEMLWFRYASNAKRGAVMPDGLLAVCAGSSEVVTMTAEEWRHYERICADAETWLVVDRQCQAADAASKGECAPRAAPLFLLWQAVLPLRRVAFGLTQWVKKSDCELG